MFRGYVITRGCYCSSACPIILQNVPNKFFMFIQCAQKKCLHTYFLWPLISKQYSWVTFLSPFSFLGLCLSFLCCCYKCHPSVMGTKPTVFWKNSFFDIFFRIRKHIFLCCSSGFDFLACTSFPLILMYYFPGCKRSIGVAFALPTQRTRVRFPVRAVSWVRFFLGVFPHP